MSNETEVDLALTSSLWIAPMVVHAFPADWQEMRELYVDVANLNPC